MGMEAYGRASSFCQENYGRTGNCWKPAWAKVIGRLKNVRRILGLQPLWRHMEFCFQFSNRLSIHSGGQVRTLVKERASEWKILEVDGCWKIMVIEWYILPVEGFYWKYMVTKKPTTLIGHRLKNKSWNKFQLL